MRIKCVSLRRFIFLMVCIMKKLSFLLVIVWLACLSACTTTPKPKYVFLFIGDGMGLAQAAAAQNYLTASNGGGLSFLRFPVTGLVCTHSANSPVTCSSAAATALATGRKTNNGMLCTAPDSAPLTAVTYPLHRAGYRVGIATSVSIDHATPAGFYARSLSRNRYNEIASQVGAAGFEFFAGSGFAATDRDDILEKISQSGCSILRGQAGAERVSADGGRVILIQTEGKNPKSLPYAIDRAPDDLRLDLITQAAVRALYGGGRGFFAMIEGGMIDWAAHGNDGATVIREVIDLSEAVQAAIDFYNKHPDETLILVTADHETGGMSVGCCGEYNFAPLAFDAQPRSATDETRDSVRLLNGRALCGWTSGGHTGIMVPIYAIGAGSGRFAGVMDNTDIPKRIAALMGVDLEL